MKKKILVVVLLFISGILGTLPGQEQGQTDNLNLLVKEIQSIWPEGNCAENISGAKKYILISIACSGDFSSNNRRAYLKAVIDKGWTVNKETYRINPNSAEYFYKFNDNKKRYIFIKLFFRNPLIVWPIHDNHRPKIAILVNNVEDSEDLEFWGNIKLPVSISLDIGNKNIEKNLEKAEELKYDKLIYFPESENKSINLDIEKTIADYLVQLKSYPEEKFPFTTLTLPQFSEIIKETKLVRFLIKTMKLYGVNKLVSVYTPEVSDTAKVLEIKSLVSIFYLGNDYEKNKILWNDAYNHAKKKGYAIIAINAKDKDSRTLLLSNISESLNFIDFVKISDLPVSENFF